MRVTVHTDRAALVLLVSLLLAGCGGGGGSSGGGGGGGSVTDDNVAFLGITFRLSTGEMLDSAPIEDPVATPPTLGGPLDLVVVYSFDGVPEGPFNTDTLPIFTTPADVTPDAQAPGGVPTILAKGTYHLVGQTIEFRPFVPTAPLQIPLSAPPESVPGLLPGSVYTARLNTALGASLGNLGAIEAATSVQFGTTSNAFAYYPKAPEDSDPPAVVSLEPVDGTTDFFPGVFSTTALGAAGPTFPPGDDQVVVGFDRPLLPTTENLQGIDADLDGVLDPTFFLRTRATRLVVAQTVPADALGSVHAEFPALSGLTEGSAPAADGSDVFLHDGTALPDPDPGLSATPVSLAPGVDPDVLFMVLPVDGGSDLLAVADRVSGDPSFAVTGLDAPDGAPVALDTGLDELVGLTTLQDGRLVAFDRDSKRIHELLPTVVRQLPGVADDGGPPVLSALTVGDGTTGFRSAPLVHPTGGGDPDVLDLLQAPSGELFALAVLAGESFPSLLRLAPIDYDLDGSFDPDDGTWSGAAADTVASFTAAYVDAVFVSDTEILALDRERDAIDRVDVDSGSVSEVVSGVGGFGALGPGEPSPARALAVGFLDLDVEAELLSNSDAGALVRLEPQGLLPVGAEITVMQRNSLTSLFGVSAVNADLDSPGSPLGAASLARYTTAEPLAGADVVIDDAFIESFDDTEYQSGTPLATSPAADWAAVVGGGGSTTSGLRAAAGAAVDGSLGDFLPAPFPSFEPSEAYVRAGLPWLGAHGINDREESDINWALTDYQTVLLNTDSQSFPLNDGSTPGVSSPVTITDGRFVFRDFIIPFGVRVVVKGSNPLRITATRKVVIDGVLDISGTDGFGDDSFDSGFLPVPGGPGGPAAGRGGTAHPTVFDPNGPGSIDQYATPERADRGWGPVLTQSGTVEMQQVGGEGGLSTLGYNPYPDDHPCAGLPRVGPAKPNGDIPNDEYHRPPGGGGGSFYRQGVASREGSGAYLVQSSSTWFPFDRCPLDDLIHDALYGNDENFWAGSTPNTPLQCVYMDGPLEAPNQLKPGSEPGEPTIFKTASADDDFYGPEGEFNVLMGGQGGGGGGTRIDSMNHGHWSGPAGFAVVDCFGSPLPAPPAPPFYPRLFIGVYASPTLYDAKGGGGGGGGGAAEIVSFGTITVSRTGHIDASGGHGGGGEVVQNSSIGAGGGGGSGGAVILRAADEIRVEADATHLDASYIDIDGDHGASIEVSGGFGRDAQTETPLSNYSIKEWTWDYTRSDGGQGGMGMIQLQPGTNDGLPIIEQGAFLFAKIRSVVKLGSWTGDNSNKQAEHPDWPFSYPDELRYVDMLHYGEFEHEPFRTDHYYVINGSYPPLIPRVEETPVVGFVNEFPVGSGQFWSDTTMTTVGSSGVPVVREPIPGRIMKTYAGYDPETFEEFGSPPGSTYGDEDEIPMSLLVREPDGTPFMIDDGSGGQIFDPLQTIDRLPVVPPSRAPAPFGTTSHGVSRWLDYQGVRLRSRELESGRTPPFFRPIEGTYNAAQGVVPAGKEGQVVLAGDVPGLPAEYVLNTGFLDPGLFGNGLSDPPLNDIKVDAPEYSVEHAVTKNATVKLLFQGAYPVRAGSQVPDPDRLTEWVSDLTQLDGFPLVRFQVFFDLGIDQDTYPFSSESLRPAVDYVRLRAEY